ncbi:unnamed protein product [Candidula unifasciata]|uniref:Uncharacterized protein n=1 Tax=Candidula unifasciata TaxID=100452 RepID=A0A8S3ZKQ0_9EUPU|nr:unnamed protein product [Candidula unifasciata]
MDLNSTYAPPINNACVPDIYNRLDADVIERTYCPLKSTLLKTRTIRVNLRYSAKSTTRTIRDAERFLMVEKSRVARELVRITQRLPTVVSLQAFDQSVKQSEHVHQHKRKSYMAAKNDDLVCHRCYVHHLPSKKQFYRFRTHKPPPAVLEARESYSITGHQPQHDQKMATKSSTSTSQNGAASFNSTDKNNYVSKDVNELSAHDQLRKPVDRFIPSVDAFKFLDRDKWGREVDQNLGDTPRLMPNELWKNFVKTMSSQYSKQLGIPTNTSRQQQSNDAFFREKSGGRRLSVVSGNKTREKSEQFSGNLRTSSSRMNIYRRPSVANEVQLNEMSHSHVHSTASAQDTNSHVSASRKATIIQDKFIFQISIKWPSEIFVCHP